jgi:tRNA-2-methylthio-N6-dimethylallyladenosine synthase
MLKTYYIKTFGCQMNYADSEKIDMILRSAGLRKVLDPVISDIVIMNTCSVRQKGEDRVFGFMNEIERYNKKNETGKNPLFAITGCMVRKSGLAKRYLPHFVIPRNEESFQGADPSWIQDDKITKEYKRQNAEKISLLENSDSLLNYDDELFLRSQSIDFVFRIEEVSFLTKILSEITGEDIGNDAKFNEYLAVKQLQENPASANVIIQTGCDNFCTFCIVPHTRGREVSRDITEIVGEVSEVVNNGTKEITLLGQNVNSYGKETKKKLWNAEELKWFQNPLEKGGSWSETEAGGLEPQDNQSSVSPTANQLLSQVAFQTPFRELLEKIDTVEWLDRIRFTSSNPHDMTRDILDAHFDLPKLCNYLHFALQSGSDAVLKRMNRKHSYADFKAQVEYLRSRDPLFSISTDIIVGFPGETEEQFQETVRAMEECQFDYAFIARYSSRSGTLATTRYEDDVSASEKARRWTILNDILRRTATARNNMMIGRTEEILITGEWKDETLVGRTRNFKEVFISYTPDIKSGDIVPVKIVEASGWVMKGERV